MGKKKKTKDKSGKEKHDKLEASLISLLEQSKGKAYSLKQIVKKLTLKKKDDIKFDGQLLDQLVEDERIQQLSNGNYKSDRKEEELTGVVDHVSSRFAYVKLGNDQKDVFIKGRDLGSAVDGDTVQIVVFATRH